MEFPSPEPTESTAGIATPTIKTGRISLERRVIQVDDRMANFIAGNDAEKAMEAEWWRILAGIRADGRRYKWDTYRPEAEESEGAAVYRYVALIWLVDGIESQVGEYTDTDGMYAALLSHVDSAWLGHHFSVPTFDGDGSPIHVNVQLYERTA